VKARRKDTGFREAGVETAKEEMDSRIEQREERFILLASSPFPNVYV
jgi:hypothetical protein